MPFLELVVPRVLAMRATVRDVPRTNHEHPTIIEAQLIQVQPEVPVRPVGSVGPQHYVQEPFEKHRAKNPSGETNRNWSEGKLNKITNDLENRHGLECKLVWGLIASSLKALDSIEENDAHNVIEHAFSIDYREKLGLIWVTYHWYGCDDIAGAQQCANTQHFKHLHFYLHLFAIFTGFCKQTRLKCSITHGGVNREANYRTHKPKFHYGANISEELLSAHIVSGRKYDEWQDQVEKQLFIKLQIPHQHSLFFFGRNMVKHIRY